MSTATATGYTGTFHGRAEEVSRVRRQVARYLDGCPVTDDAVLASSEFAANAVLHSRSRGEHFTTAFSCTPATSGWNARMRAARGEAGITMTTGPTD